MKISSAKNIDRKHYARGRGLIEFALNEAGLKIFPELKGKKTFAQYYDGPILQPVDSLHPKYTELQSNQIQFELLNEYAELPLQKECLHF